LALGPAHDIDRHAQDRLGPVDEPSGEPAVGEHVPNLPAVVGQAVRGLAGRAELAVITNIGFARPVLAVAAEHAVPVAADVQAVDALDDAYNADWMRAATVLFCSHERLPCSPEDWITGVWDRYGCELLVDWSPGGAVLGVRDGREVHRVPAAAPRGVVNTVGAGDALAAAFLYVLTRTGDPHLALEQAVLFAGNRVGATAGEDGWLTGHELAGTPPCPTHQPHLTILAFVDGK
jgi:hypothetical protein